MRRVLWAGLLLAAVLIPPGFAQTGPAVVQRHGHEFRSDPASRSGWHVYRGGVQVGYYRDDTSRYWPFDATTRTFGPPQAPPWLTESKPQPTNYGVDTGKLAGGSGEAFRLNGRSVERGEALRVLAGKDLPDNRHRLRLTVIGPDAERRRVLADLASPDLAAFRETLLVQDYPADHWAVTGAGFKADGRPAVYLQSPSGRVLHRQDDYADGAVGLVKALRRARPDYRSENDPDLRKDALPFRLPTPPVPLPVLASAAGLIFLLLLPR